MIVSIIDRDFKGDVFEDMPCERGVQHLDKIFNKLCLPLPEDDDVQVTREGGFNLFLNYYGCVLRFYEREYIIPNEGVKTANEHLCHHLSLPFIGHVRFGTFNMQVMPGVVPVANSNFVKATQKTFTQDMNDLCDASESNLGHIYADRRDENSLVLLDTVQCFDGHQDYYRRYLKNNTQRIIERSEFISDLQENFYKAWMSNQSADMEQFWKNTRAIHEQGERLHAGWLEENNPILDRENINKEDFIAKSKAYHSRHFA
jgi:hypothetical protein